MTRHLIASSLLALALAGCGPAASDDSTGNAVANDAATVEVTGSPGTIGANGPSLVATPKFVEQAAISDMYEIAAAKMALTKSQSPEIKKFAQMMIDAHGETSAKLKPLTEAASAPLPATVDVRHQEMLDMLAKADAKDFDGKYVDQQTTAHREALGLMDSYATHGDDAGLKAFAAETKAAVQMHLSTVSNLDHKGADETAK